MRRRGYRLGFACAALLVCLVPLACSEEQPRRAADNPNRPGWHEIRLLKRSGVIHDFQPVRPEKPVEYPAEYKVNDGQARVRFARGRTAREPDVEIEGASRQFADEITETLEERSSTGSR